MTSSLKKFSLESVLTKVYALIIFLQNPTDCTYLLSILYNIAFFMQFTTIPFLIKNIGISDIQYGYIQTIFGFYQMCGGPIYGFIIKKFGIRNALYLCYGSTMLSGVLLFNSTDFTSLIISRTPCLFMHGQQGHQSMLSFLTNPGKERTNAFGRMGLTFGLGFMFTPIFTIISSQISYRTPMLISAVLCILPVVLLHSVSINSYKKVVEDSPVDSKVTVNLYSIIDILKRPGIANILLKKNAPIVPMLLCFAIMQE